MAKPPSPLQKGDGAVPRQRSESRGDARPEAYIVMRTPFGAHAFHLGRSKDMQRRCFNQTTTLDERLEEQAERLRKEAEGKPPSN